MLQRFHFVGWDEGDSMPDNFHSLQIKLAAALLAGVIVFYVFAPAGKSEFLAALGTGLFGFLTGKFSNGFKKDEGEGDAKATRRRS